MAAQKFRVIFTQSAWNDLEEIVAYWTECDEPERADTRDDLPVRSDPPTKRSRHRPRWPLSSAPPPNPHTQSFRLKPPDRILYLIREADGVVGVLRFWHSHPR